MQFTRYIYLTAFIFKIVMKWENLPKYCHLILNSENRKVLDSQGFNDNHPQF